MRRKSKGHLIGNTTGDIKHDLKPGQLAGIGAVAMAWNSVESFVDAALLALLGMPSGVGLDVIARIGSFDARVALINRIGEVRLGISKEQCPDVFAAVNDALASAKDLKAYRDEVIHCQLINASEALGLLVKRDAQFEVLLSREALDGLYTRLISVRDELRTVCLICVTLNEALKADAQADLQTLLRGPEVQAHVSQVRKHRSVRRSLPPLPKFRE